uniref:U6 snRNA-associated Sm-like protein LSm1 n=1 Tax=Fibrocapsa japonica TaxID=94617 RepID=A0A7S2XVC4_9STRA|mmetsp:Transcript_12413/g.18298  ORF Transcript_12413/g.18298 Transcript_12413/m.18298 type:complete len:120 (+) Transcript_12413:160-519(+)|eukprot:CAMPEP_0113935254 /NCGR_PEP_ID=MMETSP1339-20121228/2430_1 /TAXON_ID=94617 /ORGANISM="Fibrocapsa japonica" /LENGTH=119 /DNA_ID=CAMNT_0000937327 /DNA_START=159 /DNA_END=518 /DNA_ORIENTATION=- /assembly_acc=CAM_ASM_000762
MAHFFAGGMSLVEQLDKKILVVLRDGRHLVGVLRSFDQFSNMVMENTHERHVVEGIFGDIPLGLYIVRGDNVVLLGEVDEEKESSSQHPRRVSAEEILHAQRNTEDKTKVAWDFDGKNF